MSTADRLSRLPPWLLLPGLLGAAAVVGLAMAVDVRLGVGALGGLVFVTFLLVDLPVAIGLWIVALYLAGVPGTKGAPTGTTVLLLAGWAGAVADGRITLRPAAPRVRWAFVAAGLLLVWVATSTLWAGDGGAARQQLGYWVTAAFALPLMATAVTRPRDALVLAMTFVLGATAIVAAGVLIGTNAAPVDALAAAQGPAGRLHAGITDPNYLAVDIAAALVLITGLLGVRELRAWRGVLLLAVPVLLFGLVATQSRGGFIASAAGVVLAATVLRGYRRRIVAGAVVVIGMLAAFLALQPRAVERLTQDDSTGTGRTDIWRIAWSVVRDHPLGGVGTGNFPIVESSYVDRVGFVRYPGMFVDERLVVHDLWLQALVELGPVGLALQLAVVVTCIGASFAAARAFDRVGRHDLAHLGRALGVGQTSTVIGSTFLSNGNDRIFWVLLALGPALLAATRATGTTGTGAATGATVATAATATRTTRTTKPQPPPGPPPASRRT